ncbi:ATP-dependent DNA helicase [Trichonephila inaurata madagascariensis]|uniref:ATP-dependent DNA helicase n=1 Tax=Trichonephila inaurata madagascariensis TaxID=2747483 RepID=A0A8X6IA27_9ARAC|nr:ATP-dependent DNA helicase [Trichonephila inaurata madagascariensis]
MLQHNNSYIKSFKSSIEKLVPDFRVVIHADKVPADEHSRRFNESTTSKGCSYHGMEKEINIVREKLDITFNYVKGTYLLVHLQRERRSDASKVLKCYKLMIWDECSMSHIAAFEALYVTLQNLRFNKKRMGCITLVLSDDFHQTFPVIPRGIRADGISVCVKASNIWPNIKRFQLSTNM